MKFIHSVAFPPHHYVSFYFASASCNNFLLTVTFSLTERKLFPTKANVISWQLRATLTLFSLNSFAFVPCYFFYFLISSELQRSTDHDTTRIMLGFAIILFLPVDGVKFYFRITKTMKRTGEFKYIFAYSVARLTRSVQVLVKIKYIVQ